MIYLEILAGGIGNRFGNKNIPKQFIEINGKPVIIYSIENFIKIKEIDKIIICCLKEWQEKLKFYINKYLKTDKEIIIVSSGDTRNDTIIKGCNFIKDNFGINKDDIIITMDSVRMFVNERIILENIKYAKVYNAVGTYYPVTDTVVEIKNNFVTQIPIRDNLYSAQTPQTFNLEKLIKYYSNLTEEELATMTEAGKIFLYNGEKIYFVKGDNDNIKITYNNDLILAKKLLLNKEINK